MPGSKLVENKIREEQNRVYQIRKQQIAMPIGVLRERTCLWKCFCEEGMMDGGGTGSMNVSRMPGVNLIVPKKKARLNLNFDFLELVSSSSFSSRLISMSWIGQEAELDFSRKLPAACRLSCVQLPARLFCMHKSSAPHRRKRIYKRLLDTKSKGTKKIPWRMKFIRF